MPGNGLDIEGAMQHAPQSERQSISWLSGGSAIGLSATITAIRANASASSY
ncbi:hypothetical protein BN1221_04628 [Brenneria goodwinii]|uniref:Uncharacterized protein n=1 Tax=Brenneria goodwinii TaxID=1109412 RepID=A0A0G4K2H7_9GAMM|nr:hypothetical protein BN1221_04628 [Brenneria goodwinii]